MNTHRRRLPGEEGVWVFILGDMVVFALFFFVYMAGLMGQPELYRESQKSLNLTIGGTNTLLLLSSSWFVATALSSLRQGLRRRARNLLMLAAACGLGFVALKFVEYGQKVDQGLLLTTNDFFMYFYVFTGIHFLHLAVGLFVLLYLWLRLGNDASPGDVQVFECGAAYWHMVDLLWLVLFPLLYMVR